MSIEYCNIDKHMEGGWVWKKKSCPHCQLSHEQEATATLLRENAELKEANHVFRIYNKAQDSVAEKESIRTTAERCIEICIRKYDDYNGIDTLCTECESTESCGECVANEIRKEFGL